MYNYGMMLNGLKDLVDNPAPRVPVVLCLDTSGSMEGDPVRDLNEGVARFLTEMRADELTRDSVEAAVVTFSDTAERVADFAGVESLQIPQLEAGGYTCMGEGLVMALDMLEERKRAYRATGVEYYQPILVVMSDGAPNGDPNIFRQAASRVRDLCANRRLTVVSVGVGREADMDMLAKLTPRSHPVNLGAAHFREFFVWLSQSVANVSASMPGDEPELDLKALSELESEPWPDSL